ncbi:hypothetical protein NON00_01885 [Roseomonas sp. GC11]|uniref:hypothetical protein n=1 Tax=Roseomonas sp. GC11 TaxID=2950546 RepID=UPI00210CB057|nr:hypothetical protein [Roseomonas sp. GC11]MCQ4158679.1 hypothetical protein [Roseomonas sp. GC11]
MPSSYAPAPRAAAPAEHHQHDHPAPPAAPLRLATQAPGLAVVLELVPGRAGHNSLLLRVSGPDGAPRDLPEAGIAGLRRPLRREAPGLFRLEGDAFARPGRWELRLDLRLSDFEQATPRLEADLPASPAP